MSLETKTEPEVQHKLAAAPSDEQVRAHWQTLETPCLYLTPDGKISGGNAAFRDLFEERYTDIEDLTDLLPALAEDDRPGFVRSLSNGIPDASQPVFSFQLRAGGRRNLLLQRASFVEDGKHDILFFFPAGHPEQDKIASAQEAREQAFEEQLYHICHNLKTPVVSLDGFLRLLTEDADQTTPEEAEHYLQRMRANVSQMDAMINRLLELCRVGRPQTAVRSFSLQDMVENLLAELRLHPDNSSMRYSFGSELPQISAREDDIRILFENLLGNAAKYRSAERPLQIEISHQAFTRFTAFHIRDNGRGIAAEDLRDISRLYQRGTNVGSVPGTGVGLAICEKVVKSHHGLMRLYSIPDIGTTVSFTLPLTDHPPTTQS